MQFKDVRIFVSLPCYGGQIYDSFQQSWTKLITWAGIRGIHLSLRQITNESLLPRARNMGVANLLDVKEHYTHVLFVDADMGFHPDNLERLLMWDKDIVGCFGPTKYIHWEKVGEALLFGRDPESHTLRYAVNFFGTDDLDCVDGFAKVKDFGLCFCLVKVSALEKMVDAYPELKVKHMGWQDGKPFGSDNCYMFFENHHDETEDRYLECDHAFLARWRAIGGDVWADMTSNLTHVGTHHFKGNGAQYYIGREWQDGKFTAIETTLGRYPKESSQPTPKRPPSRGIGYNVVVFTDNKGPFWRAFDEMASLVTHSLRELGLTVTRNENHLDPLRTNIIFNWHLWNGSEHPVEQIRGHQCILFQGEQIMQGGKPLPEWYFQSLIEADAVWEYSPEHMRILEHNDIRVHYVPPGYHPKMKRLPPSEDKEHDVLFIGTPNLRRKFMCELLGSLCKVHCLEDCYGKERDQQIAKSRLVLNVHYYTAQTLELLRLAHLITNSVPVISEVSDKNPYGDGIHMAPYRDLPKTVLGYLSNPSRLDDLGKRGSEAIQTLPMADIVARALVDGKFEEDLPMGLETPGATPSVP